MRKRLRPLAGRRSDSDSDEPDIDFPRGSLAAFLNTRVKLWTCISDVLGRGARPGWLIVAERLSELKEFNDVITVAWLKRIEAQNVSPALQSTAFVEQVAQMAPCTVEVFMQALGDEYSVLRNMIGDELKACASDLLAYGSSRSQLTGCEACASGCCCKAHQRTQGKGAHSSNPIAGQCAIVVSLRCARRVRGFLL